MNQQQGNNMFPNQQPNMTNQQSNMNPNTSNQYGGMPPGGHVGNSTFPFSPNMQQGGMRGGNMFPAYGNMTSSPSPGFQQRMMSPQAMMGNNMNQGSSQFNNMQGGMQMRQFGPNYYQGNQFPGNQFHGNQYPSNQYPGQQFPPNLSANNPFAQQSMYNVNQGNCNQNNSWSQPQQFMNLQNAWSNSPGHGMRESQRDCSRSSSSSRDERDRRRPRSRDRDRSWSRDDKRDRKDRGERSSKSSKSGRGSSWRDQRGGDRRESRDRRRSSPPSRSRTSSSSKENLTWQEKGSRVVDKYLEGKLVESSDSEDEVKTDAWSRCSPADLYFVKDPKTGHTHAKKRMLDLEKKFEDNILKRAERVRASKPPVPQVVRKVNLHTCQHHNQANDCSSSESSDSEDESNFKSDMERKMNHPERIHPELWFNEKGSMNDGPLCRCSIKSKRSGIRHAIYPGEELIPKCEPENNNISSLHHYRLVISPTTNFQIQSPTTIDYDSHQYVFEGFSIFSHFPVDGFPTFKFIRFNMDYKVTVVKEDPPENFSVRSLDMIHDFLYREILELTDENWKGHGCEEGCDRIHFMPRFTRTLPENGKEILSMNEVLNYLLKNSKPVVNEMDLATVLKYDEQEWKHYISSIKGYIITRPGMRPSSVRVDNLDRSQVKENVINYPNLIHFGKKPPQMSYCRDPSYMKAHKNWAKFRHLLALKPRLNQEDRDKLSSLENKVHELKIKCTVKRDVVVEQTCEDWMRTGLKTDVTQHALMLPLLVSHFRLHKSFEVLEEHLGYKFKDPYILRLALTHPSQRMYYGINPDHDRNSLSHCGLRNVMYGDRNIFTVSGRKRGIIALLRIMSQMGYKEEKMSDINHNERLEYLGDAVIELVSSAHLYYMFPGSDEGVLTAYRSALVQNQHLCILGRNLHIDKYMLYSHGSDLCHEADLKHAIANCFEAIMGALFIDGGIEVTGKIFVRTLFEDEKLRKIWMDLPLHPLQQCEPDGDRHWISASPILQKLVKFEEDTGITFKHIRLLARAFTPRFIGFTNLTLGHNETMEFLGDTVLKLVCSDYLFRHFPNHHEGHLSLLRSVLVNKFTQSVACDDLGLQEYTIKSNAPEHAQAGVFTVKSRADLLEAFLGALYVDKGLKHCDAFCHAVFFPRLKHFILTQEWNDAKSLLQQCCLSLRKVDEEAPDMPVYKVVHQCGPTNTRIFTVAVYFRNQRLAKGGGYNIQTAEMHAAENALKEHDKIFPTQLIDSKYKKFLRLNEKRKHEPM